MCGRYFSFYGIIHRHLFSSSKEKRTDYRFYDSRDRVIEREVFLWFYRVDKYAGYGFNNYRIMIYDGIVQKIVDID